MKETYLKFIRGASGTGCSKFGVALVTSSLIVFLLFELFRIIGFITNSYVGLIAYLLLPGLFFVGLALIPIGWILWKRRTGRPLSELLNRRFDEKYLSVGVYCSGLIRTVSLLTLINIVIIGTIGIRMLHFMDQPSFCGTACHSVMNPEWVTYQQSPHARVRCVECHVGEGVDALIDSKLNGMWQMISITLNLYERPIPTPVRNLRPARETCEKCHWPDLFHGNRIRNFVNYGFDEASIPEYTTLLMKIGSGQKGLDIGSHWHIAENNKVRYASVDDEREEMIWIEALQADGSYTRYFNKKLNRDIEVKSSQVREMDCVDCHNRATHIYEESERAVDERFSMGKIDRSLPFVKRRSHGALINNYPNNATAMDAIDSHIRGYYRSEHPDILSTKSKEIDTAVQTVQDIYARNIHKRMNITWGSYRSHLGHTHGGGCFRCHNPYMVDDKDNSIPMECTQCHSILALGSDVPYKYLYPISSADSVDADREMHKYLQREFRQFTKD